MSVPRARTVLPLLAAALLAGCGEGPIAPRAERHAAEAAVVEWKARHPAEWTGAVESDAALTRPDWTPACGDPASPGYVSLRHSSSLGELELAFRCTIHPAATPEEMQQAFVRAVLHEVPTGISAPNWRFAAWLPMHTIFDGVTFHTTATGRLAIDIRTSMRGVRGESLRRGCAPRPAEVPGCLLLRDHAVPLLVRYTVPADLAALR